MSHNSVEYCNFVFSMATVVVRQGGMLPKKAPCCSVYVWSYSGSLLHFVTYMLPFVTSFSKVL